MAEDFYAAFGLGEDGQHINTIDADGVALAALQGLHQTVRDQEAQIAEQQARIEALETRLAALEGAPAGNGRSAPPSSPSPPAGWMLVGGVFLFFAVLFRRSQS